MVGIIGYVGYAPALVIRQHGGMQFVPRTKGIDQFYGLFKDPVMQEVLGVIKQDWKHLVLLKIKGLRDPSTSEDYARWRNLVPSTTINEEIKSPQSNEKLVKRKRTDNEEDWRRQVEKLMIELSKSKKEKAMMEEMVVEGDKKKTFLDEQI